MSDRNCDPSWPSTLRWSKDSESCVTCRTTTSPSTTHGVGRTTPKHRMADSPGLRIGVPLSTPKVPTLVIVIVPSAMSAGDVRPSRAVSVSACSARASSSRES